MDAQTLDSLSILSIFTSHIKDDLLRDAQQTKASFTLRKDNKTGTYRRVELLPPTTHTEHQIY